MFCGNCGKKIHENMLYCPFCGKAVVIPDQDDETEEYDDEKENRFGATVTSKRKPRKTISLFDESEYGPETEEKASETVADVEDPPFEKKSIMLKKAPEEDADSRDADTEKKDDVPAIGFVDTEDAYDDADTEDEDAYDDADTEDEDAYDDADTEDEDAYDDADTEDEDAYNGEGNSTAKDRSRVVPMPVMHRRGTGTFIPVRNTRSEDMFLGTEEDEEDEYDDYDEFDDYDADDTDDYEPQRPKKSFFKRHIVGVITVCTVLVLVFAAGIFVCTGAGQQLLAKVNLAWQPNAYAAVGYEDYQNGKYAESANYYAKAYEKDKDNYEYAHSAMVAYYNAEDIDNAARMAIVCIDMRPEDAEPYRELLSIYANAEMPTMVRDYIQQGYRNTGDPYLDPNNWVNQ